MKPVLPIGRTLGPYQILRQIGHGGMGEIYKGFHPALDRHVAIKVLGCSQEADPSLTQRFQREAKAAAGLRHPNIVQVFDFGLQDNVYYLVMEFVEGTDLRTEMDRRRRADQPFERDEVLRVLGKIADALDYAHQRGVIHRDITPANILLANDTKLLHIRSYQFLTILRHDDTSLSYICYTFIQSVILLRCSYLYTSTTTLLCIQTGYAFASS